MCPEPILGDKPQAANADTALEPLHDVMRRTFAEKALREMDPVFRDVKQTQNVNEKITITRDKAVTIPIACEFLNGNVKVKNMEIGTMSFDLNRQTQTASNVKGISFDLDVFGQPHKVALQQIRVTQDKEGNKFLSAEVDNLLPKPAERILGLPPTLSVQMPITPDGFIQPPKLSLVFSDAASKTSQSIAGLLAADALQEASKVALFVESNPAWINHVVQPALQEVYKALQTTPKPQDVPKPPAAVATPAAPAGKPSDVQAGSAPAAVKPPEVQLKTGDHDCTLTVQGAERHYKVHVPSSYNGKTPMPLVIVLHGHGQDGPELARHTKMNELAEKKGFIAVYPDARQWAGRDEWRAWDTGNGLLPPGSKADDVGFLRQIIEKSEKDYLVDSKRIFMAGLSNGGMMTFRAAGELSDKLAAIAVVSGAMGGSEPPPKHPLSVLNIHGTKDGIVPYDGLKNVPASLSAIGLPKFKPMDYATKFWIEQNKIATPPLVLSDKNVVQRRFIDTTAGVEVNEFTINGGTHIPADIEKLTETIWHFFEAHPKVAGQASGTVQINPQEQPFNLTERLKVHAKTRGIQGLELDFGKMLNEVPNVGDGKFSPANSIKTFETRSGIELNDKIHEFIKSTAEVSKTGDRISLSFLSPRKIDVNQGSGPIKLNSVNVKDSSFDLISQNGAPVMHNINGVSLTMTALNRQFDVPVRFAAQRLDSAGAPFYEVRTDNPMPKYAQWLMLADSQIPVEMKLSSTGEPYVLNERRIKDATLGFNPITRGYLDTGAHIYNFYERPSWGGGLNVGKDLAIYGGISYGAYRLTAGRMAMKGRVGVAVAAGTLLAPSLIHGIERLID